jgi:putative nucleotidyltransferase with HDIG domain
MKRNKEAAGGDVSGHSAFFRTLKPSKLRPGPAAATVGAFCVSLAVILAGRGSPRGGAGDLRDFEVGRVAERDVLAEQTISYIDEAATQAELESRERLVPAVFTYSIPTTEGIREKYGRFLALSRELFAEGTPLAAYESAIAAEFPGFFSGNTLEALYADPARNVLAECGAAVLEQLLDRGIFFIPSSGLGDYNPEVLELVHNYGSRAEREQLAYDRLLTLEGAEEAIRHQAAGGAFPVSFALIAVALLKPFMAENVFFSPGDTRQRLEELRAKAEPVIKRIERGSRVIKKGFIVTEDDMARLRALNTSLSNRDPRSVIGQVLVLLLLYGLFAFLGGRRNLGRTFNPPEIYLLCILAAAYIGGAVFFHNLSFEGDLPTALFLPTALVVMLPSILVGPRIAVVMALVLPLVAFLSGSFDVHSYVFALTSGVVAAYTIRGAEKRIDLIKAGLVIGAANALALVAVLLLRRSPIGTYPSLLFWAAFNGLASGMLVLGFLPLLENALNAVTTFRLIELSDLNSPLLKRLFNAAPGTYSHSIMVANLAESACQEIGANSLLARVGAYYHDIGKMEQPDYFVENQTVYNKHEDIAPRLSATVIRSHVKLGVEKARSLGLPKAVVDIIAEHHGNSVITWFYNAALKRESPEAQKKSPVNIEDFTYPGNPPRSRESAVVMLADVTEAAVRTLKKPTASRLEKFIQELIMAKVEHGQLAESELTFRELETIKKAFVRVLAGHYHSRIEYPKLPKDAGASPAAPAAPADPVPPEGGPR